MPRLIDCGRYGLVVQWPDGAWIFTPSLAQALEAKHPLALDGPP